MRVEVSVKFYIDIRKPYIDLLLQNNDTYKEFKEDLICEIMNDSLYYISENFKGNYEEISIEGKPKPYDEGSIDFNDILSKAKKYYMKNKNE